MQSRGQRAKRRRPVDSLLKHASGEEDLSEDSDDWKLMENSSDDPAYEVSEEEDEDSSVELDEEEQENVEVCSKRVKSSRKRLSISDDDEEEDGEEDNRDCPEEILNLQSRRISSPPSRKTSTSGFSDYFQNMDLAESDDSLAEEDLEDLMFGLTDNGASKKGARRRKGKKSGKLYAKSLGSQKAKKHSASQAAKVLTPEGICLMREANNLYLEGEFDKCIELLKKVIALCPGAHDPFHLMGLIYETHHKDIRKAINAFLVAASILKSDVDLWTRIGRMAESAGVNTVAIYCYRRVLPLSRHTGEINEMIALDLARLYYKRLDFQRAAYYIQKFFVKHPSESSIALELARCYLNLQSPSCAAIVLEIALAACLTPELRGSRFTTKLHQHEWLINDDSKFDSSDICYSILTAHFTDPLSEGGGGGGGGGRRSSVEGLGGGVVAEAAATSSVEDDENGESDDRPEINWEAATILLGICIEVEESERAAEFGSKLLLMEYNKTGVEVEHQLLTIDVPFAVKYFAASVRAKQQWCHADNSCKLLLSRIDGSIEDPNRRTAYLNDLADAYFAADQPATALNIYQMSSSDISEIMLSEFRLKAAKCYIRLKDFDRAADFLELLAPTTPSGVKDGVPSRAHLGDVVLRMRAVEARLLLSQIYKGEQVTDNKEDEAAKVLTRDKRIRYLVVGSAMTDIPMSHILEDDRRRIVARVLVHSDLTNLAANEIKCCKEIDQWISTHECDKIAAPEISQATREAYLKKQMQPILNQKFTIADIWAGLSDMSLVTQSAGSSITSNETCASCGSALCALRIERFLYTWRLRICAEYTVLVRDAAADMRRVLMESSRFRALSLARQVKIQKAMPEEPVTNGTLTEPISAGQSQASLESDASGPINGYILKTVHKTAITNFQRRQNHAVRRLNTQTSVCHSRIISNLSVPVLEDMLGWSNYTRFLELGTLLLLGQNLPGLAIELLECILLSVRYSRAAKNPTITSLRVHFRQRIRRLILRTAAGSGLLRVWLQQLRSKILCPLWTNPSEREHVWIYDRALQCFGLTLFSGTFSHNALTSIAASSFKDVISFNRAWTIRQCLQHPAHFPLVLFLGHFCTLSARFVFAAAEYTRAVNLRPYSCVASLCLAVSTMAMSTSRGIQDRHHVVLRALSAFERYKRVRQAWCDSLCQRLTKFAQEKVLKAVKSSSDSLDFWKRIAEIVDAVSDSKSNIIEESILAQLLSCRVTEWVQKYITELKEVCACEVLYDEARLYHHMNLGQIAMTRYEEVLRRLDALSINESREALVRTLRGIPRGSHSTSALVHLSQSRFPPALNYAVCSTRKKKCSQHRYCEHSANRTGAVQWPLGVEGVDALMFAQLAGHDENHCSSLLPLEKLKLDSLKLSSSDYIMLPERSTENPMIGDLNDLDALLQKRPTLDLPKIRGAVNATMTKYVANLPPGLHLLTTDCAQLRVCAAFNVSAICRGTLTYSYARAIQRAHICW